MEITYYIRCMFPKKRLYNFKNMLSKESITCRSSENATLQEIMRDTLDVLIKSGIDKENVLISTTNLNEKPEIYLTILDNVSVFKIAKILRLTLPTKNNKLLTRLGGSYCVVSFDAVRALGV